MRKYVVLSYGFLPHPTTIKWKSLGKPGK